MAVFSSIASAILGPTAATWLVELTAAGLQLAAGVGLSLIGKALAGQESNLNSAKVSLQSGDAVSRSIPIGFGITAGSLVYYNSWGSSKEYITFVIALGDRKGFSPGALWADDKLITRLPADTDAAKGIPLSEYRRSGIDHGWVKFYDGTQTTADTFLTGTVSSTDRPYSSARVGYGIPYMIVTWKQAERSDGDQTPLFSGSPPKTKIEFARGTPLLDITDGAQNPANEATWGGGVGDYNPAVQIYNLMRGLKDLNGSWLYGMQGISDAQLPTADWSTQITKAQAAIAKPGGGTEPTYRAGADIQVNQPVKDVLDSLAMACQGRIFSVGGIFKMRLGAPDASVMSLTDLDILSTEEIPYTPFFGLSDTINGITGTFPNPDEGWNSKGAPPLLRPTLEARHGNRRLLANVALNYVPYPAQVQRLMLSAFNEAQRERRFTMVLGPQCWPLEPGDVFAWTSTRNSFTAKLFRIDGYVDRANLDVMVVVTEVDPTDYSWNPVTDYHAVTAGPVNMVQVPSLVMSGWQAFPDSIGGDDGTPRRPTIRVQYDAGMTDVQALHVQVRNKATAELAFDSDSVPYGAPYAVKLNGTFLPATTYQVRGIFIRKSGQQATWSSWIDVTTDALYITFPDIDAAINAALKSARDNADDLWREVQEIVLRFQDDTWNTLKNLQQVRTELVTADNGARAYALDQITVAVGTVNGTITAVAQRVTNLEAIVNDPTTGVITTAQALVTTQAIVTSQGLTVSSHTAQIAALQSTVNDPSTGVLATSTALGALTTTVTVTQAGQIAANSASIVSINSAINGYSGANAVANAVTTLTTNVSTAQTTADSKVKTFIQGTIPTSITAGDLWADTSNGNKLYRATGIGDTTIAAGHWVAVDDTRKVSTFVQSGTPTALAIGDLWVDTGNSNILKRASATGAGSWAAVDDARIALTATATTALQTQFGNSGSSTVFSMNAGYTPAAGWTSAIMLQASTTAGGTKRDAGLVLETDATHSRIRFIGTQVVFTDNSGNIYALFDATGAQFNNARIINLETVNLHAGNITVDTIAVGSSVGSGSINYGAASQGNRVAYGITTTETLTALNGAPITIGTFALAANDRPMVAGMVVHLTWPNFGTAVTFTLTITATGYSPNAWAISYGRGASAGGTEDLVLGAIFTGSFTGSSTVTGVFSTSFTSALNITVGPTSSLAAFTATR